MNEESKDTSNVVANLSKAIEDLVLDAYKRGEAEGRKSGMEDAEKICKELYFQYANVSHPTGSTSLGYEFANSCLKIANEIRAAIRKKERA